MNTEEQAKAKWCPFARVQFYARDDGQNPAVNRPECNVNCIGSECMAWRWREGWDEDTKSFTTLYRKTPTRGGHFENAPLGYCGLAGQP
jgi:hypothetical protein